MVACSLPNCKNRSEMGFRLFGIPQGNKNKKRIREWLNFLNRKDLPVRVHICEVHFDENQFESGRKDNRKLLKWNAVPTIKGTTQMSSTRESCVLEPEATEITEKAILNDTEIGHSENLSKHANEKDLDSEVGLEDTRFITNLQFQEQKNQLKCALKKINILENRLKAYEDKFQAIFNQDQITFITNRTHRGVEWSEDSIQKGLRLYAACGAKGYEEIRKQNLPYPSIRTLQHRFRNIKFETSVSEDIVALLQLEVSAFNQ